MKPLPLLLMALVTLCACSTKKPETSSSPVDSAAVDSTLATTPAPALLAFSAMDGYVTNNGVNLSDSTNYFHLASQDELDRYFTRSATADPGLPPDFIINYVVGVACAPSHRTATIEMDKVVTSESSIDVYLAVTRGEQGKSKTASGRVFAIERREGYPVMQFYVNGKKDKAIVLVENP